MQTLHLDQELGDSTNLDDIQAHTFVHTSGSQSHIDLPFRIEVRVWLITIRYDTVECCLQRTNQCVQISSLRLSRSVIETELLTAFP